MPGAAVAVTDLVSWCLAPGYIDLHTHGFHGHDVTIGSQEDVKAMAHKLPQTGVTSFFPTIATTERAKTVQQVMWIANAAQSQANRGPILSAEVMGIRRV